VITFPEVTIMRRIWIILLVFTGVFLGPNSFAQQNAEKASKKDSYSSVKSRANTNDIQRLLSDAEKIKITNPKGALENVQEALAMSIAEEDQFNEGKSYLLLGEINESIQEWKLALDNYLNAYQKLYPNESQQDRKISGKLAGPANRYPEFKKSLAGLGNTNFKLGQFDDALKYYRELLTHNLNADEKAECQLNISEVYYGMKNYDQALKALDEINDLSKNKSSSISIRIQNQRAKIYLQQNQLDKTQKLYSNSLQDIRSGQAAPSAAVQQSTQETKEELAGALKEQEKYDDEINLRRQAIEYNVETNNLPEVTRDKLAISNSLATKGDIPEALKEAEEAVMIADTIDNPKEQANAYLSLADLYEKSGKSTKAITAYKKYSQAVAESEKLNAIRLTERSELINKQKDIEELSKTVSIGQREEKIQNQTVFRQQLIIYGLLLIILIVAVAAYFIYRSAQASKTANQMLALKSLRSQMNPHFIFNALNSVNHFIAQQDERTANKFLSEFSQLMRLVLENSQEDFIPLTKEQEILALYLKLEHYRFRDKFDYEINIDETISTETVEVPPMLIQPYIENAVWHGLRYKETKGKLLLNISTENGFLVVEVVDDGIGRKKSGELKTANQRKHNSTGLKNIQERLQIINKVYKSHYRVDIEDLTEEGGTRVKIYLPITKTQAA
jgi:tetratricopeptide (TPR) repeat protein